MIQSQKFVFRFVVVIATFAACVVSARADSMPAISQSLGQANLSWQQRFLGIIPLVKPDPKDPVVVNVTGTAITAAQVHDYAKTESRMINATSTQETAAVWKDATENLINRTLLIQEAQRRKVTVPEAEVAQRAREFQVAGLNGETASSTGAPDAQLLAAVRDSMTVEKMLDDDFRGHHVSPTDQQIKEYYDSHRDLFIKDPGEVEIAHIAVKIPPNPTDAQKKAAEDKIIKIYNQARKSKDFAALATSNSEDSQSASKGGHLGFFRPGQLPPVVDKMVFSTPVGGLTPIVESNIGYSFIKVISRRGETYAPLTEVKAKIALVLLDYSEEDVVKSLLKKLQKTARIEFKTPPGAKS
jgi:parvulin-like peptidyl-prolyl isomerase